MGIVNFTTSFYPTKRLKKIWLRIIAANPIFRPTQSFDYYKWLFFAFYSHPTKVMRWRIIFNYVKLEGEECIVPLVINHKKKAIRGIAHYGRLDYEDIICSTSDVSIIKVFLSKIFALYPDYSIDIININEESILYSIFGEYMNFHESCVKLDFQDYENHYLGKISKHQRQNIRTAYNKIYKEEFSIKLTSYDEHTSIPNSTWKRCQVIYDNRHNYYASRIQAWYIRQTNPYTHILRHITGWHTYILYHDEDIMAYMSGIYDKISNCFYVPRLCINNLYAKYSPGILLLNETIKLLTSEGVRHLDLMSGNEPYKIAMGGIPNTNYRLKCSVTKLLKVCTHQ